MATIPTVPAPTPAPAPPAWVPCPLERLNLEVKVTNF